MAFLIEMVADGGMNGREFLQTSRTAKPLHGPFSSSERIALRRVARPRLIPHHGVVAQHLHNSRSVWQPQDLTFPGSPDNSYEIKMELKKHNLLAVRDEPHARRLLRAAALTYVAASLMSLLNVARWWAILRR